MIGYNAAVRNIAQLSKNLYLGGGYKYNDKVEGMIDMAAFIYEFDKVKVYNDWKEAYKILLKEYYDSVAEEMSK